MRFLMFILLSCTLFLGACDERRYSGGLVVTGKVGEILVVCDQGVWNSDLKKCLDTNLTQFIMPYFPDVATFELIHRTPANFEGAIKRHRNVLFITLDAKAKIEKGTIQKRKSVWADDQLVVEVIAKDMNQLVETCQSGLKFAHSEFDYIEWKRLLKYFKSNDDERIQSKLRKNFGIQIALPQGAEIVSTRPNFYRIEMPTASRPIEFVGSGTQDVGAIFSGVMIYQYDFKDKSQLELKNLLQARDTMLKYNVPHEIQGLYMGTQLTEFVYPEMTMTTNSNKTIKGFEMRGMFQFKGNSTYSTGGAFWSFHFVHPRTKKVICVSGYVDAPSTTSWTHSLREIQAIWKSVEIAK